MEKLKSETDNKINPMNNEIEKCATKLSDLANIRVKLAQQLKATDAEIVAVENRKKTLTQSVNETVVTYERMLTKVIHCFHFFHSSFFLSFFLFLYLFTLLFFLMFFFFSLFLSNQFDFFQE